MLGKDYIPRFPTELQNWPIMNISAAPLYFFAPHCAHKNYSSRKNDKISVFF